MNDIVDNLKKLCDEHEKQLAEIRQKISSIELVPKAKSLVGTYFKSCNSYGYFGFGVKKAKYKGYVYRRIIGYDKEYVIVDTFSTEHPGKIEITFNEKQYVTNFTHKSLTTISEKEYFKAFNKLVKYIFETGKKEK